MSNTMREILFRGKRVDNGEWVKGFYVIIAKENHCIFTGRIDLAQGSIGYEYFKVDPKTVGQYTGLTDKNGTKIFEGDLVISTSPNRLSNKPILVKFCPLSGYFMCNPERQPLIIGNIHDNPELLEENDG